MAMGLRFAGTAEFAGLDATPNFKRADQLLTHAQRAFDGIDVADGSEWTGQRPATPDSLPVIGPATRFKNVFYAFGHGHLGLTAGAVTGKHIADLVAGRPADIDLTPFRIDRFV
jgi:D-amino-acid dehydrogenase